MATNIEMNILKADGNYDTLYPKTLGSLVNGAVASATNATTATKLQTGRTIRTNLGSANSATFDGSSDIIPGITGTLSTSHGGTSANSAPGGLYNLIVGCSTRTASQVNNYASSTYLGAYYNTTGYRIAISNLLTYFQNNLSISGGVKVTSGIFTGTGSTSEIITGLTTVEFFSMSIFSNTAVNIMRQPYDEGILFGFKNKNGGNCQTYSIYSYNFGEVVGAMYTGTIISGGTIRIVGGQGVIALICYSGNKSNWVAIGT